MRATAMQWLTGADANQVRRKESRFERQQPLMQKGRSAQALRP
jgi:hypothetical protein